MSEKGFSLVELSVVVVIIALLVAGVSSGEKLLENARLKSVINNIDKTRAAIASFENIYSQLPGDIPNAYDYWGSSLSCTNALALDSDTDGCNGDGDGVIENNAAENLLEGIRAWAALTLEGLIKDTLTGDIGVGTYNCNPGVNTLKDGLGGGITIGGNNTNQLMIGSRVSANDNCWGEHFTPRQAKIIDAKIDDSSASSGYVLGQEGNPSGDSVYCLSSGEYKVSENQKACYLAIDNVY